MLQFAPGALLAAILRGHANERLGNYNAALADYDRIVKITPKSLPFTLAYALDSRAWLRATCPDRSLRNGTQAVAGAQLACKSVNWAKSDYIDTLAAAYAETRDFDGASSYEQKAVERVSRRLAHHGQRPPGRSRDMRASPCHVPAPRAVSRDALGWLSETTLRLK